ncbi:hypothetical protein FBU59_003383, partial [Linderina macrospora]
AGNFRFVQCGGKKKRVHGWYCKYVCHCYGRPEVKAKSRMAVLEGRVAKSARKSKKVGCPCAAYVTCDVDGTATIRYFPTHSGHELTRKCALKHSRRATRNSPLSESPSATLLTESPSPIQLTPVPDTPLTVCMSRASSASAPSASAGTLMGSGALSRLHTQAIQIAPAPAPYATSGLTQWMTLWKTLGHLPFVETAPFSFGFVRAQALSCLPSKDDHVSSLVLSLERAMGTNIQGFPLYTLSVLDPEDSSSEHLGYLVTADMSHGAVERWLEHLRDSLHMSPQTCILDPDDIAGHAAVNMAFGSECLVLWVLDCTKCWWLAVELPSFADIRAPKYGNVRPVEEIIWTLLALAIDGDPPGHAEATRPCRYSVALNCINVVRTACSSAASLLLRSTTSCLGSILPTTWATVSI